MIETLQGLRGEHPDTRWCLILGMDAFTLIDTWHRWDELLDYAHLLIAHRPGAPIPDRGSAAGLLERHRVRDFRAIREHAAGHIVVLDMPMLDVSSSQIRELRTNARSIAYLVPREVQHYIEEKELYAA
jgi:nicotinate-nucleotide adenylyltransferase